MTKRIVLSMNCGPRFSLCQEDGASESTGLWGPVGHLSSHNGPLPHRISAERHWALCSVENSPTNTSSSGPRPPGHVSSQLASSLEDNQTLCQESWAQRWAEGSPMQPPASQGWPGCLWSGDQGDPVRHQGFYLVIC